MVDQNGKPPCAADEQLAQLLAKKPIDELMGAIFELYPVGCINMQRFNGQELDKLIETVKITQGNKTDTIKEIISVVRAAYSGSKTDSPVIHAAVEEIKTSIDSGQEDFSVRDFVKKRNLSLYYMLHQFKKMTGCTVGEYKTEQKLRKAKNALANSEKSITDIAMECGFCSSSYFSKQFKRATSVSPSAYRKILKETVRNSDVLQHASDQDLVLYSKLPHIHFLDVDVHGFGPSDAVRHSQVVLPSEEFGFLHEAAIVAFHGVLFAAWYNCKRLELQGRTPVRFARSFDGGKTWTDAATVADDPEGNILYCPPAFGICDDTLYLFINEMVKPDHIHALNLYVYDEKSCTFSLLWSKPIPFKLNTNAYPLPGGKWMLPGRLGKLDGFPTTPALMISDLGKLDTDWRMVSMQADGRLPDGANLVFPELSAIVNGETVYMFSRNDERSIPLVYISADCGETWTLYAHDIPFSSSKIYSGTLRDGRHYVVGNLYPDRSKLAIFFSESNEVKFTKGIVLQDGFSEQFGYGGGWHYPCAYESDGKLYVIYTANIHSTIRRGAVVSVIDLANI